MGDRKYELFFVHKAIGNRCDICDARDDCFSGSCTAICCDFCKYEKTDDSYCFSGNDKCYILKTT